MTRLGQAQRPWTNDELSYLNAQYGRMAPGEIGEALRRSTIGIVRQATRLGLPGRHTAAIRSVKHDYFGSLETPLQAYVLGLLAADGCVSPRNQIRLVLHQKDADLVRLVRDELAPDAVVRERASVVVLCLTSARMAQDLGRYGVVARKSGVFAWPAALRRDLERPFLLGYFDGDGSLTLSHSRYGRLHPRWNLYGLRGFLASAADVIESHTGIRPSGPRHDYRKVTLHVLSATCAKASAIDAWLHLDGLGLPRKRVPT